MSVMLFILSHLFCNVILPPFNEIWGGGILKSAVGWVEFVLSEIGENYIHVPLLSRERWYGTLITIRYSSSF